MTRADFFVRAGLLVPFLQLTNQAARSWIEQESKQALRFDPIAKEELWTRLRQHFEALGQIGGV